MANVNEHNHVRYLRVNIVMIWPPSTKLEKPPVRWWCPPPKKIWESSYFFVITFGHFPFKIVLACHQGRLSPLIDEGGMYLGSSVDPLPIYSYFFGLQKGKGSYTGLLKFKGLCWLRHYNSLIALSQQNWYTLLHFHDIDSTRRVNYYTVWPYFSHYHDIVIIVCLVKSLAVWYRKR